MGMMGCTTGGAVGCESGGGASECCTCSCNQSSISVCAWTITISGVTVPSEYTTLTGITSAMVNGTFSVPGSLVGACGASYQLAVGTGGCCAGLGFLTDGGGGIFRFGISITDCPSATCNYSIGFAFTKPASQGEPLPVANCTGTETYQLYSYYFGGLSSDNGTVTITPL